jgi:hypothetical protein
MKSRIYSIALMAVMSLTAHGIAAAQTAAPAAPVAPVPPVARLARVAPVPPVSPDEEVGVRMQSNSYVTDAQDSTFRTKMRKLNDQMRALTREMSDLSREQSRKIAAVAQEKTAAVRKTFAVKFDSTFNRNLNRTFSNTTRFTSDNDANLLKQVASGEVKEKSKTFSKSYALDANDRLDIDNRYGKVTVNTWAKNEVKVDVDIKGYSMDESDAQKLVDQTSISADKDGNVVAFKTNIDLGRNSWWGSSSENGKLTKVHKVIINYTVYMPVKGALNISNRYGQVSLPNLDGKLNINNSYGGLVAKALTNSDNVIVVRYGDANITSLNGSDLDVAYGSLALESADKLTAKISYSTAKIGKLTTSGDINVRYGNGLAINDLGKQLKTLTVTSSYAPVRLGSTADINADFDVTVRYAEFMYNNAVKVTSQTPDKERGYTSTKTYKGQIGKGSNDKVITINANYGGGVKFD